MDFADYRPVPGDVQEMLLKAYLEDEEGRLATVIPSVVEGFCIIKKS